MNRKFKSEINTMISLIKTINQMFLFQVKGHSKLIKIGNGCIGNFNKQVGTFIQWVIMNYRTRAIITRSWILTLHKARTHYIKVPNMSNIFPNSHLIQKCIHNQQLFQNSCGFRAPFRYWFFFMLGFTTRKPNKTF